MKRSIEFKYQDEKFFLEENGTPVFSIKISDLKFDSLAFYNGLYKGQSPNIELLDKSGSDPYKKGKYIFDWMSKIVSDIRNEFPELIAEDEADQEAKQETDQGTDAASIRLIPLFEFSACAGDGFFIDANIPHKDIPDDTGGADFAVQVSGNSMEPTIKDGSIIYVKQAEELQHNDTGLFVVNGNVMCKRFKKQGRGVILVPDNSEYKSIRKRDINSYRLLGKVLI